MGKQPDGPLSNAYHRAAKNRHLRTAKFQDEFVERRDAAAETSRQRRVNHSGEITWAAPFFQGSFALTNAIRVMPGNHDIDMIVVTHPDSDHLNGL
jgi:phosphoribosyl 1,2-cyclic phosphodiesterase